MAEPKEQWEVDALNNALDHIKDSELWSDEFYPEGGFHLMPRPKESRVDVIEINLLFSDLEDEDYVYNPENELILDDHDDEDYTSRLNGVININVFHTDIARIEQLSTLVEQIIERAYINGFLYRKDFFRLFKQGKYLFCNNLRYKFSMSKEDFAKYYVDQQQD